MYAQAVLCSAGYAMGVFQSSCVTTVSDCVAARQDEGESEFAFTQAHVDSLVRQWVHKLRGPMKPTPEHFVALDLCVSE